MTVEAWINPKWEGAAAGIVCKWFGNEGQQGYSAALESTGQAYLLVCSDGSASAVGVDHQIVYSTSIVPLDRWTHFAGVYDGTYLKVYLNGVLEGQVTWTKGIFAGTSPLVIGKALYQSPFTGIIDEPTLYNRALSGAEIAAIYQAGSAGKMPFCSPHKATATAVVTNGFLIGATITDSGCGYTNTPKVWIQGGGGSGAAATAVVNNGMVVQIIVTDAGFGYTNAPIITLSSPPFEPSLSIAVSKVKVTQNVMYGRNYVLESSFDTVNWTATGPQFTAETESIVSEFDVTETGRFFRIRQVP
jgi:hypothetical protein